MAFKFLRPIVFFDLETTGTSVATDKIVSICAIKLHTDASIEKKYKLINPGRPIPPEATEIHKITDADVRDAPRFLSVAKSLAAFMSGCDYGGFNARRFDVPLLAEEFGRAGILWPQRGYAVIDVYDIFAKKEKRDLSNAYKFYTGREMKNAHNAEADIEATIEAFKGQLEMYNDIGETPEEIYDFCTGGEKYLDLAGKIKIDANGDFVYNFGNDIGKKIKDFPNLAKWALNKDFTDNTKMHLKRILHVNRS